jgi:uncharacterized protein (TIGR03086 family)
MIDLKPACHRMIDVLAAVSDEQMGNATPCTDYTVGDLIDHVDLVARGSTGLALQAPGPGDLETVHLQPDWQHRVAAHLRAMGEAWDDPAAWEGDGSARGSDLSNETWAKIALTELVVHGWDIAVATGQTYTLPEHTLQACLDHVAVFVPNAPVPGLFGPAVEVHPMAPLLDRIVAITGRTPA